MLFRSRVESWQIPSGSEKILYYLVVNEIPKSPERVSTSIPHNRPHAACASRP